MQVNDERPASEDHEEILLQGYEQFIREGRPAIIPYTVIRTWNKIKNNIFEMLAVELKDREKTYRILDIGCECGFDAFHLSRAFPDFKLEFVGIDIYPEKIEIANRRVKEHGYTNCTFKQGNAEELNFPAESFDFIICSEVIEHLYKPKKALSDMYNILKREGYLILTTPNIDNKLRLFAPKFLRRRWAEWMGEKKEIHPERKEPHRYVHHIGERGIKEWLNMITKVGFQIVDTKRAELIYGSRFFDNHQILTGLTIVLDGFLDRFTHYFSWNVTIKARKV
jgi:ubiquinone/menaquinone biosynthesis C-methylase UbiE